MGRVNVVGAGPAGMMAAIFAARAGARVLLLEKNSQPGKKLLLTGSGRCNLTNIFAGEDLLGHYPGGGRFLHSCLANFPPQAICAFFQELGVELVQEDEGKIFPRTGEAGDVLAALLGELERLGVEIHYNHPLAELLIEEGAICGLTTGDGKKFSGQKVILATGGASYPATGSTGDGYRIAKKTGHRIIDPGPALVPLLLAERWPRSLSGLAFPAEAQLQVGKRTIVEQGQLLCTHFGLSGPLALNLSRHVTGKTALRLNLLPQLGAEEIFRDSASTIGQRLDRLLPHRLNRKLLELGQIEPSTKNLAPGPREQLSKLIFSLPLTVTGTRPQAQAMVTRGGVALNQVNPKTMASKDVGGLYFAGEVLDLDGICGGYNLTAAFATGAAAGRAAGGA